jgi:hypothetical protein
LEEKIEEDKNSNEEGLWKTQQVKEDINECFGEPCKKGGRKG